MCLAPNPKVLEEVQIIELETIWIATEYNWNLRSYITRLWHKSLYEESLVIGLMITKVFEKVWHTLSLSLLTFSNKPLYELPSQL